MKNSSFAQFKHRLGLEVLNHPVITANPYTPWFREGVISLEQARAFLVQFSVFSNEFLFAQLRKMVNADTIEEMRSSKEILANEIGVGYRGRTRDDAELGSLDGTVEGGTFHFGAAHFELLLRMAKPLNLTLAQLGKRRFGTPDTLHFCDELMRLYSNEDYAVAEAASWAVENWAAAGFWDDLVSGWRAFREAQDLPGLNIGFFSWHARLEQTHAQHTWDELETFYRERDVDEDAFVRDANEMLDGVLVFWKGLDEQRRHIGKASTLAIAS